MSNFLSCAVAYLKAADPGPGSAASALERQNEPVLLSVANGLALAYVVDEPQGLVFVQRRHLDDSGMTEPDLYNIAMTNLGKLCADQLRVEKHGPVYGVFLDGNFEASVFVLESLWRRDLAHLVDKGFAICLPARDILAFCDMDSQEGTAALQHMIGKVRRRRPSAYENDFPDSEEVDLTQNFLVHRTPRTWKTHQFRWFG